METTFATDEKNISRLVSETNLKHIAIIMDGNRRWAKERGLPSAIGHKKGVDALKKTVYACDDYGVKYLTVYAFSTENWNRKPDEVEFLMNLLGNTINNELKELNENGVVITFLGDLTRLNTKLQEILYNAVEVTRDNTGVHLQIAFNYGSRAEIVNAAKNISEKVKTGEINPDEITEEIISDNLYTSSMPDPDLLIRTGGEVRVSNYLLWQIAYSEILIMDEYWPEFDKGSLADAIREFYGRNRRLGK
ncbi:MAG: isoprenyl transferase [Candidatus Gastranaerophilales bacterium]|nr:isoprenyl transferase [Candidatus Gastranaerophilales bacterium]